MSNLVPVQDMQVMANAIVKSSFYGFKSVDQVMAVMLVAQAENKHPATVVQEYDIIQGKPALKSQAMLARFQQAGGKVEWVTVSPTAVAGVFSHPQGGSLKVEWTIQMAKQAGLYREGSGWTKYPEDMLRSRCISRGVRSVFPGCILGHYAPDEVAEFAKPSANHVEAPTSPVKDMGMVDIVPQHISSLEDDVEALLPFAVLLPSGEVYASFDKIEDWMECYSEMVGKIRSSTKLNSDAKNAKVQDFRKANEAQRKKLDVSQMALLAQWTAEESKTVPKSQPPEELHNENPY